MSEEYYSLGGQKYSKLITKGTYAKPPPRRGLRERYEELPPPSIGSPFQVSSIQQPPVWWLIKVADSDAEVEVQATNSNEAWQKAIIQKPEWGEKFGSATIKQLTGLTAVPIGQVPQTSNMYPPPMGQTSNMYPPPMGQTSNMYPPPMGQTSNMYPPPMGQTSNMYPPPMGQTSNMYPPPMGQTSNMYPPPMGQTTYPPPNQQINQAPNALQQQASLGSQMPQQQSLVTANITPSQTDFPDNVVFRKDAVVGGLANIGNLTVPGNTDLYGTTTFNGATEFKKGFTTTFNNQPTMNNGLTVSGDLYLSDGSHSINGKRFDVNTPAIFTQGLSVGGNLTKIDSDLEVGGNLSFNKPLKLQNGINVVGPSKLQGSLDLSNGNHTIDGTLDVNAVSTFNQGLTTSGYQTAINSSTLDVNSNMTVSKLAKLTSGLQVGGNTKFDGDVEITGKLTLPNSSSFGQSSTYSSDTNPYFSNPLWLKTGFTTSGDAQFSSGNVVFSKDAQINSDAYANFNKGAFIDKSNFKNGEIYLTANKMNVSSPTTFKLPVNFENTIDATNKVNLYAGANIGNGVTIDNNKISDDEILFTSRSFGVNSPSTFQQPVTMLKGLKASDDVTFNGTQTFSGSKLTVDSPATFSKPVTFNDTANFTQPTTLMSDLNVSGNTTLGGTQTNIFSNAAFGKPVQFDDISTFAKSATFNDDLLVNGNATFNGDLIFKKPITLQDIKIAGKPEFGDVATFNENADFKKNVTIAGRSYYTDDATFYGTTNVKDLNIGGELNVNKFSINKDVNYPLPDFNANANTNIKGTLNVDENSNFNKNTTISNLKVLGLTQLEKDINVNANANVAGKLGVQYGMEVNNEKSVFNADVDVIGKLSADDLVAKNLNVTNNFKVSGVFSPDTIDVQKTLTTNNLIVNGKASFLTNQSLDLPKTNVQGNINLKHYLYSGQEESLLGLTQENGNVYTNWNFVQGSVGSNPIFTINKSGTFNTLGSISANNLSIAKDATVQGMLKTSGASTVGGNLTVGGSIINGDGSNVGGQGLKINSGWANPADKTENRPLSVNVRSQPALDVYTDRSVNVATNLNVGGNTAITGNTTVGGNATVSGFAKTAGDAQIGGSAYILGGSLDVKSPDSTNIYGSSLTRTDEGGNPHLWKWWHMNTQYGQNDLQLWEYAGAQCGGKGANDRCGPVMKVKSLTGVTEFPYGIKSSPYGQTHLSVTNDPAGWPNGTTKLIDTAWTDTDQVNIYTPGTVSKNPALTLKANGNNSFPQNLAVGGNLTVSGLASVGNRLVGSTDGSGNFWMGLKGSGTEPDRLAISINGDATTGKVNTINLAKNVSVSGDMSAKNVNISNGFNAPAANSTLYGVTLDAAGINAVGGTNSYIPIKAGLDFGTNDTSRDSSAGKIAYGNAWDASSFNIIGKGTSAGNRSIHMWDNLIIDGNLTVKGQINGQTTSTSTSAASTTTTSGGGVSSSLSSIDNRQIKPNDASAKGMQYGFGAMTNNNDGSAGWADYLHFNSYGDSSGGRQNLMMLDKSKIGMRVYQAPFKDLNPYQQYKDVVMTDTNTNNVTVGGKLTANSLSSNSDVTIKDWNLQQDANGGLCFRKNNANIFCVNNNGSLYK